MTSVAVAERGRVHVAVHRGAALLVGTGVDPVALASEEGAEHGLAVGDEAPRALALQPQERFGMAYQGQQRFTAVGGVAGRRGRTGPSGNAIPPIAFSYGDATPAAIYTLPDAGLLAELKLIVDEPFDGAGSQLRLLTGTGLVLMADTENDPAYASTYEATPAEALPAGTSILLEITPGAGATAGTGQILLNIH